MFAASHPFWSVLRLAVVCGTALAGLYISATQFDATEWQALGGVVAGGIGAEMLRPTLRLAGRMMHHEPESEPDEDVVVELD